METLGLTVIKNLTPSINPPSNDLAVTEAPQEPFKVGGNVLFPSSNIFGIPDLLITHQCDQLLNPCLPWAKMAFSRMSGLLHFYVDDFRFDPSLWNEPEKIFKTKVTALVEPNYTLSLDSPLSWVIWCTYRKRWLARFWQQSGYTIVVDLNVPAEFYPLSLLGVPEGWRSYATRGYPTRLESLEAEYEIAVKHAGTSDIFFMVYGGERKVWQLCKDRGWTWVASEDQRARGRIYE